MSLKTDMQSWIKNAEVAGNNNFGAAAELMREAIHENDRLREALTAAENRTEIGECVSSTFSATSAVTPSASKPLADSELSNSSRSNLAGDDCSPIISPAFQFMFL